MFFREYCKILNNSFFIEDLLIISFRNFYLMIDNWYFRVTFYYCKIRPRYRKNFAIDRSKLVFRYLIISLLQRFVSGSNCKEKLMALNWTILVSKFSKYIYSRSSRPDVFCWKGVLKTTVPESLSFKRLCTHVFFCQFCEIFKSTFL